MDNKNIWVLTAKNIFGNKYGKPRNRSHIRSSINRDIFNTKKLSVRGEAAQSTFSNLINNEISTVFYYIDKSDPKHVSNPERKHVILLLKKYKSYFKENEEEYNKLVNAINIYKHKT